MDRLASPTGPRSRPGPAAIDSAPAATRPGARCSTYVPESTDQRPDLHPADRDHVLDRLLDLPDARAVPAQSRWPSVIHRIHAWMRHYPAFEDSTCPTGGTTSPRPCWRIVLMLVILYFLGLFFRSWVYRTLDWFLLHVPVVATIYRAVAQRGRFAGEPVPGRRRTSSGSSWSSSPTRGCARWAWSPTRCTTSPPAGPS